MLREEAINTLYGMQGDYLNFDLLCVKDKYEALDMAIKALEQEPVLDKIRAEIEQKARPNEIGGRGNGKSIRYGLYMALEIIDKYSDDWACKGCWCDDGEVHIDCVFCDKIIESEE